MSRSRTDLTAYAGLAASVVAFALVLAAPWHALALVGALMLACVPAGAAVMCWVDSGEATAQIGLTLVISLSVFALSSSIIIWLAAWQPRILLALGGVGAISCGTRLRRTAKR